MDEKWVEEFCQKYKKHIGLQFHCDMHPAYIREEIIDKLHTINLRTLTVGIQSSLSGVRKQRYKRDTPDDTILKGLDVLNRFGVKVHYDFIFDDPLAEPGELEHCFTWLSQRQRPFYVAMYSLQHFPKTDYTKRLLKDGAITEDRVDGSNEKGLYEFRVSFKIEDRDKETEMLLKLIGLFNRRFIIRKDLGIDVPTRLILLLYSMSKKPGLKCIAGILINRLYYCNTYIFHPVYNYQRLLKFVKTKL